MGIFPCVFVKPLCYFILCPLETLASHASPFFLIYAYKYLIYAKQSFLSALKVRNVVKGSPGL